MGSPVWEETVGPQPGVGGVRVPSLGGGLQGGAILGGGPLGSPAWEETVGPQPGAGGVRVSSLGGGHWDPQSGRRAVEVLKLAGRPQGSPAYLGVCVLEEGKRV